MHIERISAADIESAHRLIRTVYDEFVAPSYPPLGNETFYRFIETAAIKSRLERGNLFLVAREDGEIVGALEMRDIHHLALFYVKKEHQGKGLGSLLLGMALDDIKTRHPSHAIISVNSSPYAVGIYERLGFVKQSEMQERDGISFVPMEVELYRGRAGAPVRETNPGK
jgi:GNAT superfamily N-acetyltransferase